MLGNTAMLVSFPGPTLTPPDQKSGNLRAHFALKWLEFFAPLPPAATQTRSGPTQISKAAAPVCPQTLGNFRLGPRRLALSEGAPTQIEGGTVSEQPVLKKAREDEANARRSVPRAALSGFVT